MNLTELLSQREGKVIVFTNGVFDILHAGHVDYLEKARDQGDALVVAVNTDESVKRLKGPTRPIHSTEDRMKVLAALRCVTCVVSFSEDTPERIISEIKPDIHTKGGDYTVDGLPESKIIQSYGGKVIIFPTLEGKSTTNALRKLGVE